LIGSVGNLNVPASPVFVLLIAFRYHVMGHGDSNIPRSLKIRVPVAFGVSREAAVRLYVEIVESCFRFGQQWQWLTEVVAPSGRATLIIPAREILMQAWLFQIVAIAASPTIW
jgi:hypothetical protein